jgi:hypothetical protein
MSRTYVPRVAVTGPRAIVSMHNKRRARRSPRVDGLSKALAGAVEMLEQRWLLAGEGLQGTYFEAPNNLGYDKNAVLYSTPVGNRVDPKIDFITPGAGADRDPFGGGAFNNAFTGANLRLQGTGLADDQFFDARWEGTLTVPGTIGAAAENFTFFTRKDDGVRLWVNGTKILDHWNDTGAVQAAPGDVSTPILLTPGTTVPILLEYTQGNGAAGVGLYWQSDTIVGPRTDGSGLPDFVPQANLNKAVTKPAPHGPERAARRRRPLPGRARLERQRQQRSLLPHRKIHQRRRNLDHRHQRPASGDRDRRLLLRRRRARPQHHLSVPRHRRKLRQPRHRRSDDHRRPGHPHDRAKSRQRPGSDRPVFQHPRGEQLQPRRRQQRHAGRPPHRPGDRLPRPRRRRRNRAGAVQRRFQRQQCHQQPHRRHRPLRRPEFHRSLGRPVARHHRRHLHLLHPLRRWHPPGGQRDVAHRSLERQPRRARTPR